ncbi:hypothetical protein J4207_00275 [Candidatus Woesearchaeota archaeon]|nr:hypothetical protein [Candidatus Woesearchaeota archaeon]
MNNTNVAYLLSIAAECSASNVKYRFVDNRWKESGDVDIIVAKSDIKKFEEVLYSHSFKRKGFWPPKSRMYKAFLNNELISIGAHVGGYYGGFGGGLGKLGKILNPVSSKHSELSILSTEEQIFILLYKYASRSKPQKYEKSYKELSSRHVSPEKLRDLCQHAFLNTGEIVFCVVKKKELADIPLKFTEKQKIALAVRGKTNTFLRFLYRIFRPAPVVAIVGCNGTGKSTMVKMLAEKLEKENLKVSTVYSGRITFQMLPINKLLHLFRPDRIERKSKGARETRIFHSPVLNAVAPFVYSAEYFLRMIKLYPKRVCNDVVLMDRAFIDVFASPNLNKKICHLLFRCMPQPQHILLRNSVAVIAQRRPEFMPHHIKQQLDAYDQLKYYILRVNTDDYDIVNVVAQKISELI